MNIFDTLLDKFKLESTRSIEEHNQELSNDNTIQNGKTIYFNNGMMYKVYPTDGNGWYDARYLVSDGVMYDLENVKDLRRIVVPKFGLFDVMAGYGVTGSLDYVMRMKAGNLRKKGLVSESDECYRKAIDLMQASGISYDEKTYLYFAKDLLREGRFEESEEEEKRIHKIYKEIQRKQAYPYDTLSQKLFFHDLNQCKLFKIDYLEIFYDGACCSKCATYHGRVYCISGRDKRFPKLPEFVKKTGKVCDECHTMARPFYFPDYNTIDYRGEELDAITISNRPFIEDDRNDLERKNYLELKKKNEFNNRPYISNDEKTYYRIKYAIPEIAPKSFNGYMRMKNSKSKNFIKIVEEAKKQGIHIKID